MILPAQLIRSRCRERIPDYVLDPSSPDKLVDVGIIKQIPMISPFIERGVHQESGKTFGLSSAGYDIRVGNFLNEAGNLTHDVSLGDGDFILGCSLEYMHLPNDVLGIVHDKSSWAREGLALQNTVLEPGWFGYITLELSFHRPGRRAHIKAGMPIAQVIFHQLVEPTEQPYGGKYQNQPAVPVESIKEAPKDSKQEALESARAIHRNNFFS